jgi:hypothetical protein
MEGFAAISEGDDPDSFDWYSVPCAASLIPEQHDRTDKMEA